MNAKFFVPFDTAQRLKEKGYPQDKSDYGYFDNGDSHPIIMFPADNFDCAAPTYHEVVDWLEGKGIYVTLDWVLLKYIETLQGTIEETFGWEGDVKRLHIDWRVTDDYPTREQAINAAILIALEML